MNRIILPPDAEEDLGEIWVYLSQQSSDEQADKFVDLIQSKFETLAKFSEMGRARHEYLVNLRSFPVKNYVIFYQPIDDGIEVLRVLHGSRDLEGIFDRIIDEAGKIN